MKCLVTGINGVVGSNLASVLTDSYGWEILGLGSSPRDGASYFRADLSRTQEVGRVAADIGRLDVVVHCAALLDNRRDPADLFSVNVVGTLNALALAKKLNAATFVNVSSVPIIGRIVTKPITELHECAPVTGYHLSKLHAEQAIALYAGADISAVSLRVPSPVGLNMPERSFLPIVLNQALRHDAIRISGDRRRRQNFLDLRDLADAVEKVARRANLGGIYNIAAERPVSNLEVVHTIVRLTESRSSVVDATDTAAEYFEDWDIDCRKANRDLGFTPRYALADSLEWILNGQP